MQTGSPRSVLIHVFAGGTPKLDNSCLNKEKAHIRLPYASHHRGGTLGKAESSSEQPKSERLLMKC